MRISAEQIEPPSRQNAKSCIFATDENQMHADKT
jgi:hypothetical protein